jgi:hypothetical protein
MRKCALLFVYGIACSIKGIEYASMKSTEAQKKKKKTKAVVVGAFSCFFFFFFDMQLQIFLDTSGDISKGEKGVPAEVRL